MTSSVSTPELDVDGDGGSNGHYNSFKRPSFSANILTISESPFPPEDDRRHNASDQDTPSPSNNHVATSNRSITSRHTYAHAFPDRADSLKDISSLAKLVDFRSNWYDDHRVSEQDMKQRTRHLNRSKAAQVVAYYERMNEILDGWREADEILDSRFPDEVMRRFAIHDQEYMHKQRELDRKASMIRNGKLIRKKAKKPDPESDDGNQSDEELDTEDDRRGRRSMKRSLSAKAASAFTGFWFHSNSSPNAAESKHGEVLPGSSREPHELDLERGRTNSKRTKDKRKQKKAQHGGIFDIDATEEEEQEAEEVVEDEAAAAASSKTDRGDASMERKQGNDTVPANDSTASEPSSLAFETKSRSDSKKTIQPRSSSMDQIRSYGSTSTSSPNACLLYDRLRQEGRVEEIRRSESNLTLASSLQSNNLRQIRPQNSNGNPLENSPRRLEVVETTQPLSKHDDKNARRHPHHHLKQAQHRLQVSSTAQERQQLLSTVPNRDKEEEMSRAIQFAININLLVNLLLLGGKGIAVISSNSISLIASLVDSALDLLSTVIIFATSKAIAYRSWRTFYKYPVGKKRLEPLGVVIFSVLMIASFCQVLIESIQRLRKMILTGQDEEAAADLPLLGLGFMLATIAIKTVMWLLYRRSKSSGVRAVAQDAENDVMLNIVSLLFPFIGSKISAPMLDPLGGIVLSIYIIYEWIHTLFETVSKLSGAVASPEEISKPLYLITRFNSVRSISAFDLFHSGDDFIAEADVVLPHSISLKDAHDLGEIITYCTESINGIERAYIHLDYNPSGQSGHIGERG